MTPSARREAERLRDEIKLLTHRLELTTDTMCSFQSSVSALALQNARDDVIEENRDKATFYFEAHLDLMIHIAKLNRELEALTKKT